MVAAVVDQICSQEGAVETGDYSDVQLIDRIRSGDRSAFEHLVATYQPSVFGLIYRLVGDIEEARDVAQDTFLRVYQKIEQFRGESNLKTWIFRIAIHQASNHRRWWFRRGRHRTISIDQSQDDENGSMMETLADQRPNSEQVMIDRERQQRLIRALGRLKPPYRAAVVLRDVEGCSYEEMAVMLGISLGTVKSRIARGREMLRQEIVNGDMRRVDD
jgi:RNA polymerase sigma-70 factor (ECF subfamily)